VVLVLNLTLMLWWGWQPDPFDVAEVTRAELQQSGGEAVPGTGCTSPAAFCTTIGCRRAR